LVGEAAMLAGIVKAPTKLAPTEDFPAARKRAQVVLAAMVDAEMISPADARRALRSVKLQEGRKSLPVGSYFADWLSPQVKQLFRGYGEVEVWTTLDSQLQLRAQQAVARVMAGAGSMGASQAALVAMRTDGRVVALVGGVDYRKSQYNRATQAERQPGSAFKPFVYLAALRRGMTPDSLVLDAPVTIGGWSPQNHEGRYAGGPVTLRDAFARSSNVAAARLVQQVGVGGVVQAARDLGIDRPLPNDATIALGTGAMSLMELTSAYAGIAAGRAPIEPHGLLQQRVEAPSRALSRREQEGLMILMREVVERGTGTAANLGPGVYGKTGTSQDYRDAYFVGFAGDLVVGVWVGNDDNTPMRKVTGGSLPAQIWRDFMGFAMKRPDFKEPVEIESSEQLFDFGGLDVAPLDTPAVDGELVAPEVGDVGPLEPGAPPPAPLDAPPPPLAAPPPVRPEALDVPPADAEPEPADEPAL
jgi:penicillin-binding protein 1A